MLRFWESTYCRLRDEYTNPASGDISVLPLTGPSRDAVMWLPEDAEFIFEGLLGVMRLSSCSVDGTAVLAG